MIQIPSEPARKLRQCFGSEPVIMSNASRLQTRPEKPCTRDAGRARKSDFAVQVERTDHSTLGMFGPIPWMGRRFAIVCALVALGSACADPSAKPATPTATTDAANTEVMPLADADAAVEDVDTTVSDTLDAAGDGGDKEVAVAPADTSADGDAADQDGAGDSDGDAVAQCSATTCADGPSCFPIGDKKPGALCVICAAVNGVASWQVAGPGVDCNDGSACTTGDHCQDGACAGKADVACDDGQPCTADGCDPAFGCQATNLPATATCSDGDACTLGDHCQAGTCIAGAPVACDDGAPCTADSCDSATGCKAVNLAATATCSDGSACTVGDHCQGGSCQPGLAAPCDDGNPCTADQCEPASGCVALDLPESATCSDGDMCTAGDHCQGGACQAGAAVPCDDGKPCTLDACDLISGCVASDLPVTATCTDGNACTADDRCKAGECQAGTSVPCDDGKLCTVDGCDPVSGCVAVDLPAATTCTDGDACTVGDHCQAGACHGGSAVACDDSNPCTADSCAAQSGCQAVQLGEAATCSDGSLCTVGDHCVAGACSGAAQLDCNDGNACTSDTCAPGQGCLHTAADAGANCSDGNACTTSDACAGTSCSGKSIDCNDDNPCTDDTCEQGPGCVWTPKSGPCDDLNPCSVNDTCTDGICYGKPKNCYADVTMPACVKATCGTQGECTFVPTNVGSCRPALTVTSPERSTFAAGAPSVVVQGQATGIAGPLATVAVNGKAANVGADGTFSIMVPISFGNNELSILATDIYGNSRRQVQALQWATAWSKPGLPVAPSGGEWLGAKALDSGNHVHGKPRDIATVFEVALSGINLGASLPSPLYTSVYGQATMTSMTYAPVQVTLTPADGYLLLTLSYSSIVIKANAAGQVCLSPYVCIPISGIITATVANLTTTGHLTPQVLLGQPQFVVDAVSTTVTGLDVTADNSTLAMAANDIKSVLGTTLVSGANQAMKDAVPALSSGVGAALAGTSLTSTVSVPKFSTSGTTELQLAGQVSDMKATSSGLAIGLQLGAAATPTGLSSSPGTPLHATCAAPPPLFGLKASTDLEFTMWDDAVNLVFWTLWRAGWFEGTVAALPLFEGSPAEILGVTAKTSAGLPPVVSDCTGPNPVIRFSELRIDMTGTLKGSPIAAVVHANMRAKLIFKYTNGELQIWLGAAEAIDAEASLPALSATSNEVDLEKYMVLWYLPGLLNQLSAQPFVALPLPVLDFSSAILQPKGTAALAIDANAANHAGGVSSVAGPVKP